MGASSLLYHCAAIRAPLLALAFDHTTMNQDSLVPGRRSCTEYRTFQKWQAGNAHVRLAPAQTPFSPGPGAATAGHACDDRETYLYVPRTHEPEAGTRAWTARHVAFSEASPCAFAVVTDALVPGRWLPFETQV
jgi:hypothetical protein